MMNALSFLFFIIASFIPLSAINVPNDTVILLGSLQFSNVVNQIDFPILYKGNEYAARIEVKGETAHFELYDSERPEELHILVTESLSLPNSTEVAHLKTSPKHAYKLFKLLLKRSDTAKEATYHWQIEELDTTQQPFVIPDATIIIFLDPSLIEKIEKSSELKETNIFYLPTIVLKSMAAGFMENLATIMKLNSLDFKFFHKKSSYAYVPYTNNIVLSMPYMPHTAQKRIRF